MLVLWAFAEKRCGGRQNIISSFLHRRIYFTFEPMQVDDETRALVRFNPDGSGGELLGRDNTLAWGVPHGLRISFEEGQAFLYHANNGHTVHKTDLEVVAYNPIRPRRCRL